MGQHVTRLTVSMVTAKEAEVAAGRDAWEQGMFDLENVKTKLQNILESPAAGQLGGVKTGESFTQALSDAVAYVVEQRDKMERGGKALTAAHVALTKAVDGQMELNQVGGPYAPRAPSAYSPPPGFADMTEREKKADRDASDQASTDRVNARELEREQRARQISDELEAGFVAPIETMKEISGYQEPTGPTGGGGSGGSGSGGGGYTPPSGGGGGPTWVTTLSSNPNDPPNPQSEPPNPIPPEPKPPNPIPPPPEPPVDPTEPTTTTTTTTPTTPTTPTTATTTPGVLGGASSLGGSTPPTSTGGLSGGMMGGVAGGIAGGAALGSIARGGGLSGLLGKGALSSRGVAPIGGSAKGSSGVLGRGAGGAASGARAAGTGGRGGAGGAAGAGRSGGGRGAGGRGAGRGGAATGRGGAGGRGGRSGKDRKSGADQDLYDDGEDWLDDEGMGPAVLD